MLARENVCGDNDLRDIERGVRRRAVCRIEITLDRSVYSVEYLARLYIRSVSSASEIHLECNRGFMFGAKLLFSPRSGAGFQDLF